MSLGHRLKPYCLPDAAYRCIPYPSRVVHLLPARLVPLVCRIPDLDRKGVFPFRGQCPGDVERERGEASGMAADLHTVDPYIGLPVHSTEIQHDPAAFPCGRDSECPGVDKLLVSSQPLPDSGKR